MSGCLAHGMVVSRGISLFLSSLSLSSSHHQNFYVIMHEMTYKITYV
jgi:hypothetical protein